jgi:hypothetical protein
MSAKGIDFIDGGAPPKKTVMLLKQIEGVGHLRLAQHESLAALRRLAQHMHEADGTNERNPVAAACVRRQTIVAKGAVA